MEKHLLMIFGRKNLDGDVRCLAHHIVHVLPVVEGDQLEGRQHGPQQVVEAGESVIWIFSNTAETDETVRTGSEFLIKYQSNSPPLVIVLHLEILMISPAKQTKIINLSVRVYTKQGKLTT